MSADTTSIFYKIGQATKTNINAAITAHKAATNVFSGASNTFQNDVTVGGNLTVNGTTTNINTTNLDVTDNFIRLSKGANQGAFTKDQGFYFERASGTEPGAFIFDESTDKFRLGTIAPTTSTTIGSETVTFRGKTASVTVILAVASGSSTTVTASRADNNGTDEVTFAYESSATIADLIASASNVSDYIEVSSTGAGTTGLSGAGASTLTLTPVDSTADNAEINGGSLDLQKVFLSGVNLGDLADFNAGYSA
jgi:hypothetical protein